MPRLPRPREFVKWVERHDHWSARGRFIYLLVRALGPRRFHWSVSVATNDYDPRSALKGVFEEGEADSVEEAKARAALTARRVFDCSPEAEWFGACVTW